MRLARRFEFRNAGVAADVVDLPRRKCDALAMEIGKAFGAAAQPKAELLDIEINRTLDIFDEQATSEIAYAPPSGIVISLCRCAWRAPRAA
ncbi:hypothetical protein AJ88_06180 [Mesorhizobium amorphae CCBAU 01583]|nr:hypothetical protein AJ88_06180 [Mesorhizobium amorphae CCBAU 01583]